MTTAERAALVAKALDRLFPGWHRLIRQNRLNMCDGRSCVGGQLAQHGLGSGTGYSYERVYSDVAAHISKRLARQLGVNQDSPAAFENAEALLMACDGKTAWINEIRARRQLDRAKAASV